MHKLEDKRLIIQSGASLPEEKFRHNQDIEEVVFEGRAEVGERVFSNCVNIRSLSLADGMSIGKAAFWGCTSIRKLVIPKDASIANGAFLRCEGITDLEVTGQVSLGKLAFGCCNIKRVILKSFIDISILKAAFSNQNPDIIWQGFPIVKTTPCLKLMHTPAYHKGFSWTLLLCNYRMEKMEKSILPFCRMN